MCCNYAICSKNQWCSQDLEIGGTMASAECKTMWGLGVCPPEGSMGFASGQGLRDGICMPSMMYDV